MSRSDSGLLAKLEGKNFESLFQSTCDRFNVVCTRMPDGCKQIGPNKIIRVRTPWDFILTFGGRTALIDTKSDQGSTFPFSAIEPHQVQEMVRHESEGTVAGYVIHLRQINAHIFVPAHRLIHLMRTGKRGSISLTHPDAVDLSDGIIQLQPRKIFQAPN